MTLPMVDLYLLIAISLTYVAGGFAKGVTGSGLPQIVVPVIALFTDVPTAVALVQIPTMSINMLQAWPAPQQRHEVLSYWPLYTITLVATIIGVVLISIAPSSFLYLFMATATLGAILLLYFNPNFVLPTRLKHPLGVSAGFGAGVSAGMSSLAGPFLVPYFLSQRINKDVFIPAISIAYLATIIPILIFFPLLGVVEWRVFLLSVIAVAPSILGMVLGNRLRNRINELQFRQWVLIVLSVSVVGLVYKGVY